MTEKNARKSPKEHLPEDVREHLKTAREEMRKSVEGLLPPEFVAHRRAARKEMLLAFRGLLDHAIQRVDERAKEA